MTITEFLLARIAEDEQANDLDVDPESWCDRVAGTHYEHARIAAECAAKRAVVQMALDSERYGYGTGTDGVKRETLGLTVRALATVYADHEDYRQEWAC